VQVPEFSSSVFIIAGAHVKNGNDRLVVLNRVARSVIDEVRGEHAEFVFTYRSHQVTKINNSAWKCARERAADQLELETNQPAPWGFRHVRVHDLKHTFGRRLRRGRFLRGPAGPARSQERTHHDALLTGGAREPDRGGGEGM
jgi:integrase